MIRRTFAYIAFTPFLMDWENSPPFPLGIWRTQPPTVFRQCVEKIYYFFNLGLFYHIPCSFTSFARKDRLELQKEHSKKSAPFLFLPKYGISYPHGCKYGTKFRKTPNVTSAMHIHTRTHCCARVGRCSPVRT